MTDFVPKINWQPDDPVTEDDFNRIEQGIADAHGKADNLKTQITEGSIQVNSAENADNLGGKPPEYYAKQSEVDEHLAESATDAHNISNITGLQTALNNKQDALPVEHRRKITFGTADPTGGSDGDIYFQYE